MTDEQPAKDKIIDMTEYNSVVYKNRGLLSDWADSKYEAIEDKSRSSEISEQVKFDELKSELLPTAIKFVDEIEITKDELEEIFDVKFKNKAEFEEALVGLLLFASTTNISLDYSNPNSRGGSFGDCFIEATGIAAGAGLIGNLARGAFSKAAVKQALAIVARVGLRTCCGVGLALIAAEIAWCMW